MVDGPLLCMKDAVGLIAQSLADMVRPHHLVSADHRRPESDFFGLDSSFTLPFLSYRRLHANVGLVHSCLNSIHSLLLRAASFDHGK